MRGSSNLNHIEESGFLQEDEQRSSPNGIIGEDIPDAAGNVVASPGSIVFRAYADEVLDGLWDVAVVAYPPEGSVPLIVVGDVCVAGPESR